MWWLRVDVSKRRFLKIEKGQILQHILHLHKIKLLLPPVHVVGT